MISWRHKASTSLGLRVREPIIGLYMRIQPWMGQAVLIQACLSSRDPGSSKVSTDSKTGIRNVSIAMLPPLVWWKNP